MSRPLRTRTVRALVGFCLLACAACAPPPAAPDDLGPVGHFSLTERGGQVVTDADLRGKVWVASFVFTRCTGPCPQVAATLTQLQSEFAPKPDVLLVTFTVDPDHDRPQELDEYARRHGADPKRWLFLTGPEDRVYELVNKNFHLFAAQNKGDDRKPGSEVAHDTRLAVVDRRGHVRGYFDGLRDTRLPDPEQAFQENLRRLRQTVDALLREAP